MDNIQKVCIVNDPEIQDQKWCCISFVMPENIKDPETELVDNKFVNKMRMLKIRGSFPTQELAEKYAIKLRDEVEPWVNVYITQVGHWIPFYDDDKYCQDVVYKENALNELMQLHKENIEKSRKYIQEKAKNETNKTVEDNNNNESTFDKINKIKNKLNLTKENDNKHLEQFRNMKLD